MSSDNDLRQLFDTVVAAPPPETTDVDAAIRVGRRQRQRRRAAVALSVVAVLAFAGVVAAHVVPGFRRPAVSAASGTVTAAGQLSGTWQALELDGKDVHAARDSHGEPLHVRFSREGGQWMWGANDVANYHSGAFSVSAQGRFRAQKGGSTLAGWIGSGPRYPENPDAVTQATEARIVPGTSTAPAKLFLLAGERVVGVYVRAPAAGLPSQGS